MVLHLYYSTSHTYSLSASDDACVDCLFRGCLQGCLFGGCLFGGFPLHGMPLQGMPSGIPSGDASSRVVSPRDASSRDASLGDASLGDASFLGCISGGRLCGMSLGLPLQYTTKIDERRCYLSSYFSIDICIN